MVSEVEAFKNELRNLPFYEKKIKEIEEEIKNINYQLEGVKGVDYTKPHGTANPSKTEEKRLDLIEKKQDLVKKRDSLWSRIEEIIHTLSLMDRVDFDIVNTLYIKKNKTYRELCDEFGIKSTSSLQFAVDKAIGNAIKKR